MPAPARRPGSRESPLVHASVSTSRSIYRAGCAMQALAFLAGWPACGEAGVRRLYICGSRHLAVSTCKQHQHLRPIFDVEQPGTKHPKAAIEQRAIVAAKGTQLRPESEGPR